MPDDKQIAHGRDRKLIAMGEDYEVRYWTKKFGVSKEELQRAVEAVGGNAAKVERFLRENARS